jgi:hypothetical protein
MVAAPGGMNVATLVVTPVGIKVENPGGSRVLIGPCAWAASLIGQPIKATASKPRVKPSAIKILYFCMASHPFFRLVKQSHYTCVRRLRNLL